MEPRALAHRVRRRPASPGPARRDVGRVRARPATQSDDHRSVIGGSRRWLGLVALTIGVAMIIVDATIVNVAIPSIIRDLGIGITQAEWANSIYSLVFAALLISVGRVGDVGGRRRVFVLGLVVFLAASLVTALAPNGTVLLAGRDRTSTLGAVRARAARRRPRGRRRLRAGRVRERQDQEHQDPSEYASGPVAGEGCGGARPAAGLGQPDPLRERARRTHRLPGLRSPPLAASADRGRHRTYSRLYDMRPHLRHLRAPRRRSGVCGLTLHRLEHRDDRPPLRPSRPRQPRARRRTP